MSLGFRLGGLILTLAVPAFAQTNHFIRDGATGTTCSNWSETNACDTLPANLIRGDTYYIADGTYPRYFFDDAESGTTLITVKKATVADHGTDVGWQDSFGDGQAVWGFEMLIDTSFIVFDGVTGGNLSSNPNDYGFKIAQPADCANPGGRQYLRVTLSGTASNVTVSHVAIVACGAAFDNVQKGIVVGCGSCAVSDSTFSHNYIEQANPDMEFGNVSNSIVEYTFFNGNWTTPANHGETFSVVCSQNNTLRYSILKGARGTAVLAGLLGTVCTAAIDGWDIHGNVVIDAVAGNGIWASGGDRQAIRNTKIHNNTYVDCQAAVFSQCNLGGSSCPVATGNVLKNNLLFNSNPSIREGDGDPVDHDFNAYFDSLSTPRSEPDGQIGSGDPFVSSATGNFHLANGNDVNAGLMLLPPFDIDRDGNTRGADGKWDRGAFDFVISGPNAPRNLRPVVK